MHILNLTESLSFTMIDPAGDVTYSMVAVLKKIALAVL